MTVITAALMLFLTLKPAGAEIAQEQARALMDAMGVTHSVRSLTESARDDAAALTAQIAPEGGAFTEREIARLYDEERAVDGMVDTFASLLSEETHEGAAAFYNGEAGQNVARFEIAARNYMAENDPLPADTWPRAIADDVDALIETYSLVGYNVAISTEAEQAFLSGLGDSASFLRRQPTRDPREREFEARQWLQSYLGLTLSGLEPEERAELLEFAASDAGQAMNDAMFSAYLSFQVELSEGLGRLVSRLTSQQDL